MATTDKEDNLKSQADTYNDISVDYQVQEGLKLMGLADVEEESKVLDLGCGTGRLTVALAERVGPKGHVVGIDPDRERIKTAREKNSRPNITYIEANGETFPEGPYNLVFSNYVLHWIEDKELVFNRVSENLCPGGKFAFIINMDHAPLIHEAFGIFIASEAERYKLVDSTLVHLPLEKLEEIAARNGFVETYKKLGKDHFCFPDVETFLQFLYGSSGGVLDPDKADEEILKQFKDKYSNKIPEVSNTIVYMVLTKS